MINNVNIMNYNDYSSYNIKEKEINKDIILCCDVVKGIEKFNKLKLDNLKAQIKSIDKNLKLPLLFDEKYKNDFLKKLKEQRKTKEKPQEKFEPTWNKFVINNPRLQKILERNNKIDKVDSYPESEVLYADDDSVTQSPLLYADEDSVTQSPVLYADDDDDDDDLVMTVNNKKRLNPLHKTKSQQELDDLFFGDINQSPFSSINNQENVYPKKKKKN